MIVVLRIMAISLNQFTPLDIPGQFLWDASTVSCLTGRGAQVNPRTNEAFLQLLAEVRGPPAEVRGQRI